MDKGRLVEIIYNVLFFGWRFHKDDRKYQFKMIVRALLFAGLLITGSLYFMTHSGISKILLFADVIGWVIFEVLEFVFGVITVAKNKMR